MTPVLQTGTELYDENNTAKSSAYQLELHILLPDTILSDQQFHEEALRVLAVSKLKSCIHTLVMMTASLEWNQFIEVSAVKNICL